MAYLRQLQARAWGFNSHLVLVGLIQMYLLLQNLLGSSYVSYIILLLL